ncbi:methyl-accepting chemotaxis protein [Pantoea eucrina]|uniref:Methyl-accepting chemotaxis protein n=1 Tax=Pantoea eucrina TaxID=472693 RepID=A0ABU5LJ92_9GAMM|nr:methyl-accepting chemotaxis protein [Pantoea eucrina]MDZ7279995.1 methyl-accepting chemotaxis protein [Pantoea eucrina]
MKNTSIGVRLGAAFGFLLILLILIATTGYTRIQSLGDTAQSLAGSRYQNVSAALSLRYNAIDMTRLVRNLVILNTGSPKQQAFKQDYDRLRDRMSRTTAQLQQTLQGSEPPAELAALQTTYQAYQRFSDDVVALAMEKSGEEDATLLFGPRFQTQMDYMNVISNIVTHQEAGMRKAASNAADERRQASRILSALSIVAILCAALLAWRITRSITRPLGVALAASQRIARGDLTTAVPVQGRDETGRLLSAIQAMQAALVQTVSTVRNNADSVATASLQIAQGNADLSQRTEEQASALEQTAATMSELSVTVRNNADNARQAAQLAVNVRKVAQQGSEVTTDINGTMKNIGESSNRIADITAVIDGIAFQTNILALNAAVEAARAGEQGRGFAVVAGEVRTLAQRSATAAGEIRRLIETNSASVKAGNDLAERSASTMAEIVSAVGQLTDTVEEIQAASAEQARGIEQVGIAVTQMDGVTQQNASLVEESASASQSLQEQAALLVQSVSVFNLAAVARAPAAPPLAARPALSASLPTLRPAAAASENWTTF